MKGLIITNAYWRAACVAEQAERIRNELRGMGADADIAANGFLPCSAGKDGISCSVAGEYDFCVYLDKDKYVSELLEAGGMRLFNTHAAIRLCDDKMRTYIALSERGLPVPLTLPAPLCYTPGSVPAAATLDAAERALGYPVVIKTAYGSGGKGVYKVGDRAEFERIESALIMQPHLYQQYIESGGCDIRIIVIGGKATGGMLRRAPCGEFRSNIAAGGKGERCEPDAEAVLLAEKAAAAVGADYAGVDLLPTDGGYMICEVNSNAFFSEFERVTGVNVARAYAEHILRALEGA